MLSKLYELALDLVPKDVTLYAVNLERTRHREDNEVELIVTVFQGDVWASGKVKVQEDPVILEYAVDEATKQALAELTDKYNDEQVLRDVLRTHSAAELVAAAKKGGLK